jgi:RimJ/RimL family protein N-acetyltransferase
MPTAIPETGPMDSVMVSLRESTFDEIGLFNDMDKQPHAREFVIQTGLETHRANFADENIVYLTIENHEGETAGYFILVIYPDRDEVEFRRILIDQDQTGIGQAAIGAMENYCRDTLGYRNIWLDVFEDNAKGRHIYQKLGYRRFKDEIYDNRLLLFYRKLL